MHIESVYAIAALLLLLGVFYMSPFEPQVEEAEDGDI